MEENHHHDHRESSFLSPSGDNDDNPPINKEVQDQEDQDDIIKEAPTHIETMKLETSRIQSEMKRVQEENQNLRIELEKVTKNYIELQALIITLQTQNPKNHHLNQNMEKENDQVIVSSSEQEVMNDASVEDGKQAYPAQAAAEGCSSQLEQEHQDTIPLRKTRVSIRTRSEDFLINDGCHWKKYGQKNIKDSCPRAYYRCSMGWKECPVRKQVQRCAEDKTVVITTYEANHIHPLPPEGTAMANATSAAASMLLSGSSISSFPNATTTISIPTINLDFATQSSNPFMQQNGVPPPLQLQDQLPPPMALPQLLQGLLPSCVVERVNAAISSDPNFTAALEAAVTSIITAAQRNNESGDGNNDNASSEVPPGSPQLPQ